jgi:hypothetical protein
MQGYGIDWSTYDTITLLKDETEDVGLVVQHEGADELYILCNRSWEMPLHHGRLNFQHPDLLLPVGALTVKVTVRGDDMDDQVHTVTLHPGDGLWIQPPPQLHELVEREGLLTAAAKGVGAPPSTPDLALVRRAIDRASAQLRKQRALIDEWRTHEFLDPDERGEWETEDRKGILHQDGRYRRAYEATEDAFNAIALMRDPTSFHRDQALAKIDIALTELAAAHPDNAAAQG